MSYNNGSYFSFPALGNNVFINKNGKTDPKTLNIGPFYVERSILI